MGRSVVPMCMYRIHQCHDIGIAGGQPLRCGPRHGTIADHREGGIRIAAVSGSLPLLNWMVFAAA